MARGASSRDVARQLVIADKTARNHIERIYAKLERATPLRQWIGDDQATVFSY